MTPQNAVSRRSGDLNCSNMIENSDGKDVVQMDEEHNEMLLVLRKFMFENVYLDNNVKRDEDVAMVDTIIKGLYQYYVDHPEDLPEDEQNYLERDGINVVVKDYIAGMTDRYAKITYQKIFG